jgi:hypothetical protein
MDLGQDSFFCCSYVKPRASPIRRAEQSPYSQTSQALIIYSLAPSAPHSPAVSLVSRSSPSQPPTKKNLKSESGP